MKEERAGAAAYLLAAIAVLGMLLTVRALAAGIFSANFYGSYYQNAVVRALYAGSLLIDLGLIALALGWRTGKWPGRSALSALAVLALIAGALPWLELWYGSTFDYPNRERQSLLINLNNGGLPGSVLFLLGALWCIPLDQRWQAWARMGKLAAALLVILGCPLAVGAAIQPWDLAQQNSWVLGRKGCLAQLTILRPLREKAVQVPMSPRPKLAFGVYFVPEQESLPSDTQIRTCVRHWLHRHAAPPLRSMLQAALDRRLLEINVEKKSNQAVPAEVLRRLGADGEPLRRYRRATYRVAIATSDRVGPPYVGLWTAIAASRAVAQSLSGVIFDPELLRLEPIETCSANLPPDPRPRIKKQILVLYSADQSGLGWITTSGMAKFGLPDLQIKDCPPDLQQRLCWVMNATARYLLAAQAEQTAGSRQPPRTLTIGPEIRLKVHELRGAPGEDRIEFKRGARGLTRIRVRYDPPRGDTDAFLTLLPPHGPEQDQGIWLNRMLDELFGSEDSICYIESSSQALAAAHERAMRGLPAVKRRFQTGLPPGWTLLVKYGFPTRAGHEYMWIAVNSWTGRHLKGQLANDPQMRMDLQAGQTVEIPEADVFDWMLQLPDGRSQGNFTRPVLEREGQTNPEGSG